MINNQNNIIAKSPGRVFFEYFLLAICLCVIAIRATFTESPNAQLASQPIRFIDLIYSLVMSGILLFVFLAWLGSAIWTKKFSYRWTGMEIGALIFFAAMVLSGIFAENKRAAISDSVMLAGPVLMGVLLVQLLDRPWKIGLVLVTVASLGVVGANQNAYEKYAINPARVEQYKEQPETILEPLGITFGSYDHMMLEHRIMSKDVHGFFTTSNSAGAFLILSFFSGAGLFFAAVKSKYHQSDKRVYLLAAGVLVLIILYGLALTQSKGATAGFILAVGLFAGYLLFGGFLDRHKKKILLICVTGLILVGAGVVWYGIRQGGLGSGNSILVRWQYWQASVKMFLDNPWLGVGGGNFGSTYTMYKPAGGLEVVSDPHNFLLSILTRFGVIGLAGFLGMLFGVFGRVIFENSDNKQEVKQKISFEKLAGIFLGVIFLTMLIVRPILMPEDAQNIFGLLFFVQFLIPAVVFGLAFWIFSGTAKSVSKKVPVFLTAGLVCALLGCLGHSLIDYALFEPGVFGAFWAAAACAVAWRCNNSKRVGVSIKLHSGLKILITVLIAGGILGFLNFAFLPVVEAGRKITAAMQNPRQAGRLLERASEDDQLDPTAAEYNAKLHLQIYEQMPVKNPAVLLKAIEYLNEAINRGENDYKNYERLSRAYLNLAKTTKTAEKPGYLEKSYEAMKKALRYYPNSGKLRFELAKIAERLGKEDTAVENFRRAVEIENSYRKQFRQMYPGRELYSRLGEANYEYALERLEKLGNKTP